MLIADKGSYVLMVFQCQPPIAPRKRNGWMHLICFGEAYHLGENHWYNDQDHFMREMYLDVVGHDEHGARRYERMVEIVHILSWRTHNEWAVDESLLRMIRTKYIIYPLMITGNGSMVMMTETVFPLPEKHIGWVYAERTVALRQVGRTSFSASSHKAIRQMISQAVSEHNQHMQGQCYGYELYRYGRCVDSDCEICGDLLWAIQQIESRLPAACRGMTRLLESG